jgi:uncharacterized RDD family membrane protein YckC
MSEPNPYRNDKTKSDLEFEELLLHPTSILNRMISLYVDITIGLLICIPIVIYGAEILSKDLRNGRIVLPIYDYKFSLAVLGTFFSVCFISAIFECSVLKGTLGKVFVGNEVVNGFKLPVSFFRAFARQFLKFGPLVLIAVFPFVEMKTFSMIVLFFIVPILAFNLFITFFSVERQSFHDLAIRTFVIRKPEKSALIPLLVLVGSIFVSIQTLSWMRTHVVTDALREVPSEVKQSILYDVLNGKKTPTIDLKERIPAAPKVADSTENHIFEVASSIIYEDVLKQDIQKIVVDSTQGKILSAKGPVYTTMTPLGSNEYEFKTYLPPIPNLLAFPKGYNLIIKSATGKNGTMLTAQQQGRVEVEDKVSGEQRYILVTSLIRFSPDEEVQQISGDVILKLPTKVEFETIRPTTESKSDNKSENKFESKEVKVGAHLFQILEMSDRSIEFIHFGPSEYFLGMIAFDKQNQLPLRGGSSIVKNSPNQAFYSYLFGRSIEKYEFNTALLYYLDTYPFSN